MSGPEHDWITVHRARFAESVDVEAQDFGVPREPSCARLGIDTHLGQDGLPVMSSKLWGAWSICPSRLVAQEIFENPTAHFPFLKASVEAWHGLLLPYTHHGAVNWCGNIESGTALRLASDPGAGPVAVLTTAAFDSDAPEEVPRILEFLTNVWRAREHFRSRAGNSGAALFSPCDELEGITLSLWDSEASMVTAAYGAGVHHDLLKRHRSEPFFDRSSFTRCRVIASSGTWDGNSPFNS